MEKELTLKSYSVGLLATGYSNIGRFWPDLNYSNQNATWATQAPTLIGGNKE